jgi:hypothetical protein
MQTQTVVYDAVVDGEVDLDTAEQVVRSNDFTDIAEPCSNFGNVDAPGPNRWSIGTLPEDVALELRFTVTDADGLESDPWILSLPAP